MDTDTPIHVTGELKSGTLFLELHTDGGATWELDPTHDALHFVGKRVEVIGVPAGFNDLICQQIWLAGEERPLVAPNRWPSWSPWTAMLLVIIAALVSLLL